MATDNSGGSDSENDGTVTSDSGSDTVDSSNSDTGPQAETDDETETFDTVDSSSADTDTATADTGEDSATEDTETATFTDTDSDDIPTDSWSEDTDSDTAIVDTGSDTEMQDTGSDTGDTHTCDAYAGIPATGYRTIDVDGTPRRYFLHVPAMYTGSTPVPLILDFHALGDSGQNYYLNTSIFPDVTDAEGVILAFPDGMSGPTGNAWDLGPCCVNDGDNVDDVAFARRIVDDVASVACIDTKKVYASGSIVGGGLAYLLACEATDMFAAVAAVNFDLLEETVNDCRPSRSVSVASFRATDDPFVFFDGGVSNFVAGQPIKFIGAENTLKKWAELNGCSGDAEIANNGCSLYSSNQCDSGVEEMLCVQGGIIHIGDGATTWDFFKRHPLP